jgi:hypothetical protein
VNRRELFFGVAGAAAAGEALTVREANASQLAEATATAMKRLHGGEWIAHVDHDAEYVLIRPRRTSD